ncbi:MAG TPA: TetR/AcrR family transcriptional regulator [Bacteroidales bacterium]|nr:TetR/AcrR family transcriptional regulator [Bacteroidales bacterium]HPT12100.1 TetR/AcrR family transcriptional regulator [Bacteroidales bacterium]
MSSYLHTDRSVFYMTDTREYIIDEAFKLFMRYSYEAVSISIISETIGLTKGALYHHFENKEELFRAVIDKHFREIVPAVVNSDTITLKEYIEESVKHTEKILRHIFSDDELFTPLNYMSLIADCFRHYKGFTDEKFGYVDNEIQTIKQILDNAIKRGEIRNDIDTNIVAMQIFSLNIGMAGDIVRNKSIEVTLNSMKLQLNQLYKLLKI